MPGEGDFHTDRVRQLYLQLLKRCLTNTIYEDGGRRFGSTPHLRRALDRLPTLRRLLQTLSSLRHRLVEPEPHDRSAREQGRDWPAQAHTMIGETRLDNLQECVEDVLRRGVEGDLIETGVWRGGATIFMRALLEAHGDTERIVWVADSFAGLPPPDPKRYRADAGDAHHRFQELAVSQEQVEENFERYGLLDDQVRFLKGWFRDTLPQAPIDSLAVMRLDGDMYESTRDALVSLYPKLSVGGYVIIDDYHAITACAQAVDDYRQANGINEEIVRIDWSGVFWQRTC